MQKIRQFFDLFFSLKAVEATGAWRALGSFWQWLITVPGAILGILMAIFRFIGKVGGAAPGFLKRLLLAAPGALLAVLLFIGAILLGIVFFVWWYVIPGLAFGGLLVGIVYVLFELTVAWWLKILAILGIIAAFVVYWNILAAATGVWGDEPTDDLIECIGRAGETIWWSFLVEALIFLAISLMIAHAEILLFFGACAVAVLCVVLLFVALLD